MDWDGGERGGWRGKRLPYYGARSVAKNAIMASVSCLDLGVSLTKQWLRLTVAATTLATAAIIAATALAVAAAHWAKVGTLSG